MFEVVDASGGCDSGTAVDVVADAFVELFYGAEAVGEGALHGVCVSGL